MNHTELLLHYADDLKKEALRAVSGKREGDNKKTRIIEYLWEVWKEDLMAPADRQRQRFSPDDLRKKFKRQEGEKGNVTIEIHYTKKALKDAELIRKEGTFRFSLRKAPYALDISVEPNSDYSIKKFWSLYQSCTREQPVLVGVLQRLFYVLKDESSDDEVYLRSRLVNLNDERQRSSILDGILAKYSSKPTRQYISSGDTAGAFTLLSRFNDIGIQAKGARLPDFRTKNSSSIILGTGLEDNVLIPGFPSDFYFRTSSHGIDDKTTKHDFKDEWKAGAPYIYALLSRWPINKNKNFCTTIHANSAAAIDGVCTALADEGSVEALLAKKSIGPKGQLIFKVGLTRGSDVNLTMHTVWVWLKGGHFSRIWPS